MTDEKAERLAAIRARNAGAKPETPARATAAAPADYEQLPAMPFHTLLLILLAAVAGALMATIVVPLWLPNLSDSLSGPEPKGFWFLSRASAFVAFGLLWLAMAMGLTMTNRMARVWPGGPVAFDLHQHASLLGLGFALFHGLVLMGDRYIGYSLREVLVPFAGQSYKPLWVGLGQIGLYLLAIVGLSFYTRRFIGRTAWRAIHFLSFVLFALALAHGIAAGSDSATPWATAIYWASGASLLFLTIYRVLVTVRGRGEGRRGDKVTG